jgi:aminoglycoside phosphotransferase (APT) family kinase protein
MAHRDLLHEFADCLPVYLRGPSTTMTRIAAGLSGASVYRVDSNGETFALKVLPREQPLNDWRRALHVQQSAAAAGLAPAIVHVAEGRRAILSAFVTGDSFPARYANLQTRAQAVAQLGRMLRGVHTLPIPAGDAPADPRAFVAARWAGPLAQFPVPGFVAEAVRRVEDEEPPPDERPLVLSHNDVNPSNLIADGERLLMLDWETAAPNHPYYDLAVAANFLRMDDDGVRMLLEGYGEPVPTVPAAFRYQRRVAAALAGSLFLDLARQGGHPGADGSETLDSTAPLGELYAAMREGTISLASPEGQWRFGLAMVKGSVDR